MSARVYTLAKELDLDNRDILDAVKQLGMVGKSSTLATLTDEEADQIKAHFRGRGIQPCEQSPAVAPPPSTATPPPSDFIVPSFCCYCGKQLEMDEHGILEQVKWFDFQSPHGHRSLIACLECKPEYKGDGSDQFFCNLCGKRVEEIKVRTVKGDTAGEVIYVPSYYHEDIEMHEALLFCNACLYEPNRPANKACGQDSHCLPDECRVCQACNVLVQRELVQYDTRCPGCECSIDVVEYTERPAADFYDPFYCSFCGGQIEVRKVTGELVDATSIPFQSPFCGCSSLVACSTCQPKIESKKSEQFFCNMCGEQITKIKPKTARDRLDFTIIFSPSSYFNYLLTCNTDDCLHKAGIGDCMPCPDCKIFIHYSVGDPNDGKCPCGHYAHGAEIYAAPGLYGDSAEGH